MAYGYEILYPSVASKIIREAKDKLLEEGNLLWVPRTDIVEADDDEMTMQYSSRIYAADIITEDAPALVRESGKFSAYTHGTNKLKHGAKLNEKQIRMLRKLLKRQFVGDNEIINFNNWVTRQWRELTTGLYQRVEAQVNSVFAGSYNYDRLGLRIEGDFGVHTDFKSVVATSHDQTSATPLKDIVTFLSYLNDHWGVKFSTITCRDAWVRAVVATTEYINEVKLVVTPYRDLNSAIDLRTANWRRHSGNIGALLTEMLGWNITVEIDENVFYEYQNDGSEGAPVKYHPEDLLYFSGVPGAFDIGNGELIESVIADMGGGNIIGSFKGAGYRGPMGYTEAPSLNPPSIATWVTAWMAPRLHDNKGIATMKWK